MNAEMLKTNMNTFHQSRNSLLYVIGFTVVNLVLTVAETGYYFLFSATLPQLAFNLGYAQATRTHNGVYTVFGAVAAMILLGLYLLCWHMSKRRQIFMLWALVLFVVDTICLAGLSFLLRGQNAYGGIIDIAFHAILLFSLIKGVVAWSKIRNVTPSDLNMNASSSQYVQPSQTADPSDGEFGNWSEKL